MNAERTPGVVAMLTHQYTPGSFSAAADIAALANRLQAAVLQQLSGAVVLYVTSCDQDDGAAMLALDLAHAAGRLIPGKVLLLADNFGQASLVPTHLGVRLPGILQGFAARGQIEIVEIGTDGQFHAAALPQGWSRHEAVMLDKLSGWLHHHYELIIVACPPVLKAPSLPRLIAAPKILLVLSAIETTATVALRAKQDITALGGALWGVVLTQVPRHMHRHGMAATSPVAHAAPPPLLPDERPAGRNFFIQHRPAASGAVPAGTVASPDRPAEFVPMPPHEPTAVRSALAMAPGPVGLNGARRRTGQPG